jgi:hypothetical protein
MRRLSSLALVAALFGFVSTLGAEGLESHVGTWKLNLAKSRTASWSPQSQTRVYEDWGNGLLHAHFEGTDSKGKPWLAEYVARPDGKEYPYVIRGATAAYTMSLVRVDDHTFAYHARADGKTAWTGTHTLAADGKSFMLTYKTDAKGEPADVMLFFEKQ